MTDLLSLLGSRICHDLVNPLGAIGNGVELLQMSGASGPELELVQGAVAAAQARLRFFRIAFGAAANDQSVPEAELRAILADMTRDSRLRVDWQVGGGISRPEARLAFLAILCAETALPRGGTVTVRRDPGWSIRAREDRVAADPALWACLTGAEPPDTLTGGTVHYALMPLAAAGAGRRIAAEAGDGALWIAF